jgi:hypothetical protein
LDILHNLGLLKDLAITLYQNRINISTGEEIIHKMSRIVEDDIEIFKEFLETISDVLMAEMPMDEILKDKVINFLDSKKLETACKNILFMYYSRKS